MLRYPVFVGLPRVTLATAAMAVSLIGPAMITAAQAADYSGKTLVVGG